MRVVYSDESGTGSEEEEPITVVAAVMLNMDSQWDPVAEDLRKLAPNDLYEFKGSRLFRDLRNGRHRSQADAILRGILDVPIHHHVPIFHGACDRKGLRRALNSFEEQIGRKLKYQATAHEMAFMACLNNVHTFMYTTLPRERMLWISDKSRYETLLRNELESFNILMQLDKSAGLPSWMQHLPTVKPHAPSIADTVYFGNSHESRALQLADVCCAVITRQLLRKPEATEYYDLIRPQIIHDGLTPLWDVATQPIVDGLLKM